MQRDSFASLAAGLPQAQPLYKEVKSRLTRGLIDAEWRPGHAIPSEAQLAARFQVSVGTVRKAIDELVAENILVRQQGRGTFVAAHTLDRTLFYFFHIAGKDGRKESPQTEVLHFTRGRADADEAMKLAIVRGDRVLRIRNLLSLAGRPVVIDDIVIAAQRFPDLDESTFSARETTIYGLYQERYGINVIRASERLSAVVASAEIAHRLDVAVGAPLLRIGRIAYTYHDIPVELRISHVNTAEHEYQSDLFKA
jgi:GntR family transcriptional regulator